MKKLVINKIKEYEYFFKDSDDKNYNLNIEFIDIDFKPKINDVIYFSNKLLSYGEKGYTFGPLNGVYGKKIISENDEDIIVLVIDNRKIYLQRYYG